VCRPQLPPGVTPVERAIISHVDVHHGFAVRHGFADVHAMLRRARGSRFFENIYIRYWLPVTSEHLSVGDVGIPGSAPVMPTSASDFGQSFVRWLPQAIEGCLGFELAEPPPAAPLPLELVKAWAVALLVSSRM
jgi:hypothetical protein